MKDIRSNLDIVGPTQLVVDGQRRWSGVPRAAAAAGPGQVTAHLWPKLLWQINRGRPDAYVRPQATWTLPTNLVRRWVTVEGDTQPVELRALPDGTNQLVPWPDDNLPDGLSYLVDPQHPTLARLMQA